MSQERRMLFSLAKYLHLEFLLAFYLHVRAGFIIALSLLLQSITTPPLTS